MKMVVHLKVDKLKSRATCHGKGKPAYDMFDFDTFRPATFAPSHTQ